MYTEVFTLLQSVRKNMDVPTHRTTLMRVARASVYAPAARHVHRRRQNIAARIVYEMANWYQGTPDTPGYSETIARCARAAYHRSIDPEYATNLLTVDNMRAAFAIIVGKSAESRLEFFDIMETRILTAEAGLECYQDMYQPIAGVEEPAQFTMSSWFNNTKKSEIKTESGDDDMARLSFDGLYLQSQLSSGQEMTLQQIATEVFGDEVNGVRVATAVSRTRAKQAAVNMVTLKRAVAIPNLIGMMSVRAQYSTEGTQLEALMNMAVRDGCTNRAEEQED